MEQFAICLLRRARRRRDYAVILQHRLLDDLDTCVIAPLVPAGQRLPVRRLRPPVRIAEKEYVLAIDRLAAVERRSIGEAVGSLAFRRDEIIAAVDLLFTGI